MFGAEDIESIKSELIASIVTGVGIFLARWTWKRIRDFRIYQRYPVKGVYMTYYEDAINGTKVVRKALLGVSQKGNSFTGENTNLGDGRDWSLRGEILQGGYLAGTYGRLDPKDPSKGTFFLEPRIETPGRYSGYWSGYDSVNKRPNTGSYEWRLIKQVQIRRLGPSSAHLSDEIVALFADALGDRFITRGNVDDLLSGATHDHLLGAFLGGRLIGVRTVRFLDRAECVEFEQQVAHAGGTLDLRNYKVGRLASNAIREDHRRAGVGSQMVQAGLQTLRTEGCTMCVAVAWESGSGESSARILEAFGFEHVATSADHWKADSLAKNYSCPKCGGPPCSCSAQFYRKRLVD